MQIGKKFREGAELAHIDIIIYALTGEDSIMGAPSEATVKTNLRIAAEFFNSAKLGVLTRIKRVTASPSTEDYCKLERAFPCIKNYGMGDVSKLLDSYENALRHFADNGELEEETKKTIADIYLARKAVLIGKKDPLSKCVSKGGIASAAGMVKAAGR